MVGRTPANIIAVRPAARRRHQRLRRDRADDQVLRRQGARPGRHDPAAADAARHPVGRDRGREAGRPRRRAQRRRPLGAASSRSRWPRRSAPACPVSEPSGQPHRRHRRRDDRGRGHLASAASSSAAASASAATRWTRTSSRSPGASTTCSSASGPPRTSRSRSARPTPGEWDAQRVTLRGRDLLTGLPRSVEVGADQIREAIEPSVAADRRHGQGHDRGDAAGARRRHHGPGHRPRRRRRAAGRASTGASPRRPRCRSTSPTTR